MRKQVHRLALFALIVSLLTFSHPVFAQDDPTPKAPPVGTNLPVTDLIFDADFSDASLWPSIQSADAAISFAMTDTGYNIAGSDPDAGIAAVSPLNLDIDNFYTEIEFTVNNCTIPESALLFFTRLSAESASIDTVNAYVFVLQCSGDYRSRLVTGGNPGGIDTSGQSAALVEGESNTFGILFSGNSVVWYVNGVEIARFEAPDIAPSGLLTPGLQRGIDYTLTSWRIWSLKSTTISNILTGAEVPSTATADDPLSSGLVGDVFYQPSILPPSPIALGLHHPVAAYISGDSLALYNNIPTAILPLSDIDQSDYYLEISFSIRECVDNASLGFVWHANADYTTYNAAQLHCDGRLSTYTVVDGERDEETQFNDAYTPILQASSIDQILALYVQGGTAYLYLDNALIATLPETELSTGHAGLLLASSDDGAKMELALDAILGYNLP